MPRVLAVTCFALVLFAPPVIAQDAQVEAKPERAKVQKVGDLTLKRGLLAKPEY